MKPFYVTRLVCGLLAVSGLSFRGWAESNQLTIVAWNVESGGSVASTIAGRIKAFQGVDLWGLCEVESESAAELFEQAAADGENADFVRIVGTTGLNGSDPDDRLEIIYNTNRFQFLDSVELHHINVSGTVRAPLVAHLRKKDSGTEFLFMVNHLYRSKTVSRHQQAQLLNAWAKTQTLPVIAVGDYNFDWAADSGEAHHDRGYDFMTQDGVFTWVRPQEMVRSECNPSFDSILDFVFVTSAALPWKATSQVIVVQGDCPDNAQTSDHRPVKTIFSLPQAMQVASKEELLSRIEAIQLEVVRLRALVNQLP